MASSQLCIGVKSGLTSNHLITDLSNLRFVENRRGQGYNISADFLYSPSGRIFLRTGISLCQKNYSLARTGGAYEDFSNTYFQLPVAVQWQVPVGKFNIYASTGIYGAWWTYARIKGSTPNVLDIATGTPGVYYFTPATYNVKYNFDPRRDNRLEYGWLTSVGAGYGYKPNIVLVASIDYSRSCSDTQKKYMLNQTAKYNETYFFSLGCQLLCGNPRHHRHNKL